MDSHFRLSEAPRCLRQEGAGDCVIVSFWASKADADASRHDAAYYAGGQRKLWRHVRYGMFKTEHFDVLSLAPEPGAAGAQPPPALSPCARLTTLALRDRRDVPALDALFRSAILPGARAQPGFVGAQRFVGVGGSDAARTYVFATFWESIGTLRASSRGSAYYDRYVPRVKAFAAAGTGLTTRLWPVLEILQNTFSGSNALHCTAQLRPGSSFLLECSAVS